MDITSLIILFVITLVNFGLLWVTKSYAEVAQTACKACISRMQNEERASATPSVQQGTNDHDT